MEASVVGRDDPSRAGHAPQPTFAWRPRDAGRDFWAQLRP